MLLLETLLLAVFMVLDIFLFYIFFESILPPLFILIGLFGSSNKVRASFYLFLYTLLGSLFLLLSILVIYSVMGTTDLDALYKLNFKTIAANSILPPKGDSTCAFSNHVFKNITGVFTAKAINIPQNKKNCVE